MIRIDLLWKVARDFRVVIIGATLVGTGLVALFGAVYLLWRQPSRATAALEFRPTFEGARDGRYPNEIPFGPSDIVAPAILDRVYDQNGVKDYCDREAFRSAFFVELQSAEISFLDADYQARLADPRLTPVERERMIAEYGAKRAALPLRYRLIFVRPRACAELPTVVVEKSMSDVLAIWAEESDAKRGVLRLNVQVLTPNALEIGLTDDGSRLIRADLIRSALRRFAQNVQAVGLLPGANLVKLPDKGTTFSELQLKFDDLVQARLEPLVIAAGRALGSDSLAWVAEALTTASRDLTAADGRARAYQAALREYSGMTPSPEAARAPSPTSSSDVQALTPQIDRTFIDRIVEMSERNTAFRQDMTRRMVTADIDAVQLRARVDHYRHLLESLRSSSTATLTPADVDARLNAIVADGKALADQFTRLYEEFSKTSLRRGPAMYQVEKPLQLSVVRPFSLRNYVMVVAVAFVISLFTAFLLCLAWNRFSLVRARMA